MIADDLARRLIVASRKGKEWTARRDQLIKEACELGATQREVAKLAGLSQPSVWAILDKEKSTSD